MSNEVAGLANARPRSVRRAVSLSMNAAGLSTEIESGTAIAAVATCGYFGHLVGPLASGNLRRASTVAVGSLWPW